MTTLRMSPNPTLARLLYGECGRQGEPVVLFDVGCSGGLEAHWREFGSSLQAVGFDALVQEIDRLNSLGDPSVQYEAARVGSKEFKLLFPKALQKNRVVSRSNISFDRTSSAAYSRLKKYNYAREMFNAGEKIVISPRLIELDEFAIDRGINKIDFLKVDTDGSDIEVILGARRLLAEGCLAVSIESQFHGAIHPYSNTFCNIDSIMRDLGYTLFDIEPIRYTRSALPGAFWWEIPAQTMNGAVQWAEAIYARDLADIDYERKHKFSPAGEDILKLAAFFDLFGLQDCAAELLLSRRQLVEPLTDVTKLLDCLTPATLGKGLSYAEYIASFRDDPDALLPSRLSTPQRPDLIIAGLREENKRLEDALNDANQRTARAVLRVNEAYAELRWARESENAIKNSTSWKITYPLRWLIDSARRVAAHR